MHAELVVHDDWVAQGIADGHITIISHQCKEDTLSTNKGVEEVKLDHTASKRYILAFHKKIH